MKVPGGIQTNFMPMELVTAGFVGSVTMIFGGSICCAWGLSITGGFGGSFSCLEQPETLIREAVVATIVRHKRCFNGLNLQRKIDSDSKRHRRPLAS